MEATFNFEDNYFKTGQKKFIYKDRDGNEHELSIKILNRILSLIANKYVRNKIKHAEYTEIASAEFCKIDPQYRYYINWLKINSIIIVDEGYVLEDKTKKIKAKCKSYAFHDEFKSWGRVVSMKRDHFDEVTNKDQNFLIQIDNTVLKNIRRDFSNLNVRDNPIQKKYKIENQNQSIINFRSYLASEFNFWRIKNKYTFYNWKSGRLWNNFVHCSKITRSNNFYFKEHLASCDIPSSFPLWLAVWLMKNGIDPESFEFQDYCTLVQPQILENGSFKQDDEGKIKTRFYEDFRQKLDNNRNMLLADTKGPKITRCQKDVYQGTGYDLDGIPAKSGWVKCKITLDENGICSEHGLISENIIVNPESKHPLLKDDSFKKEDENKIKTQLYEDLDQRLETSRNSLLPTTERKKPICCQKKDYKETEFDHDGFPMKSGWVKCKQKIDDDGCCLEHGYMTEIVITNDNRSEKPHISRGQAKELFSTWLNGDNTLTTLVNAVFGIYYPDILAIVDTHKDGIKNYMYEKLVSLETNFIFNIICSRFYAEIPNIQIITCHDEIYFEQKYKTQVDAIWQQELIKVYETLPSIECREGDDINDEEFDSGEMYMNHNWRMLDINDQEDVDEAEI